MTPRAPSFNKPQRGPFVFTIISQRSLARRHRSHRRRATPNAPSPPDPSSTSVPGSGVTCEIVSDASVPL